MVADEGADCGVVAKQQFHGRTAKHDEDTEEDVKDTDSVGGPALANDPGGGGSKGEDEDQEGDLGYEPSRGEVQGFGGFGISDVSPEVERVGEQGQRQQGDQELKVPHRSYGRQRAGGGKTAGGREGEIRSRRDTLI